MHPVGVHDNLDTVVLLVPEHLVRPGRVVKRQVMRDDKRRVDLAALDSIQQRLHILLHALYTAWV